MKRLAVVATAIWLLATPVAAAPDLTISSSNYDQTRTLEGGDVAIFQGSITLEAGVGEAAADLDIAYDESDGKVSWSATWVMQRDDTDQVLGPVQVEEGASLDDVFEGRYHFEIHVQVPEVIGTFEASLVVQATSIDGRQDTAKVPLAMHFTVNDGPDSDADGLSDKREAALGTDPEKRDTDGDNLSDCQEVKHTVYSECWERDRTEFDGGFGTDPLKEDTDGDGLLDSQEVYGETDALKADTDEDGLNDKDEVSPEHDTDPLDPDTDDDGLLDGAEVELGTDPHRVDTDGDGLLDGAEVNGTHNAAWGNESTDPLKTDTDGDGLSDDEEMLELGTNPNAKDSDGDGMLDKEEVSRGRSDPVVADTDGDGINDPEELLKLTTDPENPDTDGDGLSDGEEVNTYLTDPKHPDTDGDGLNDYDEVAIWNTNPLVQDSDDDGLKDGPEVHEFGTDPAYFDSDFDGLSDGEEGRLYGTLPTVADFDDDLLNDGDEIVAGTDPLVPDSDGDGYLDGDEALYGGDPLDEAVWPPDLDGDLIPDVRDSDADGDGIDDMARWTDAARALADEATVDTGGVRAASAPAPAVFSANASAADGFQLWRLADGNWSVIAEGPASNLTDPHATDGRQYRITPFWNIGAKQTGRAQQAGELPDFEEVPILSAMFTDVRLEGDVLRLRNGGPDTDFILEAGGQSHSIALQARSEQTVPVAQIAEPGQSIVWIHDGERVELGSVGSPPADEGAPTLPWMLVAVTLALLAWRRR